MSTHRSFTVRVPLELYLELAKLAEDDGRNLNYKVNELIRIGIDKEAALDTALRRLITGVPPRLEVTC